MDRHVITFCRQLDTLLGGGVQTGTITEFCGTISSKQFDIETIYCFYFLGVPGIGKTQLGYYITALLASEYLNCWMCSIQLALDVQIPECFRGRGGTAVYLGKLVTCLRFESHQIFSFFHKREIDTEGSFIPERAAGMASELAKHLSNISRVVLIDLFGLHNLRLCKSDPGKGPSASCRPSKSCF